MNNNDVMKQLTEEYVTPPAPRMSDLLVLAEAKGPKRGFDLHSGTKWNDEYTAHDLGNALDDLFQTVASDLGVKSEDPSDPAFLDYAGDTMSDAKVPEKLLRKALKWLKAGSKTKYDRETKRWVYVGLEDDDDRKAAAAERKEWGDPGNMGPENPIFRRKVK